VDHQIYPEYRGFLIMEVYYHMAGVKKIAILDITEAESMCLSYNKHRKCPKAAFQSESLRLWTMPYSFRE
jgi:hypothetical protein